MKHKRGFTLVELISVIGLLAILLIITIPAVTNVSDSSKIMLRDSKVATIVLAGEEYGNEIINRFQNCIGGDNESLKDCLVPINTLVENGYMEADKDNEKIIDPITNAPMDGKVLLCYNPNDVLLYGTYVEEGESYTCTEYSLNGNNSLNLSSIAGIGYVGKENKIEVNIIKSGTFSGGFECKSEKPSIASCNVDGNTLEIFPTSTPFSDEFIEVPITLTGIYDGGLLSKTYTLKVYPTKLSIKDPASSDSSKSCLPLATTDTLELDKLNEGDFFVESSDSDILNGSAKGNILYIASKNKTGVAKLTVKESHGQNEASITRTVYDLKIGSDSKKIPDSLVINDSVVIPINYVETGPITITATDSQIVSFSSAHNPEAASITLSDDTEFTIKAKKSGSTKIKIMGEKCGIFEIDFSVTNLNLESSNGTVYTNGNTLTTEIITNDTSGLTCTSSDPEAATCAVHATTLEIYPGSKANDNVILTVSGVAGHKEYHLTVLSTSIEAVDRFGEQVDKLCTEVGSGINDKDVFITGNNMGETIIENLEVWELADATVEKDGDLRSLIIQNREITEGMGRDPFHDGFNAGRTRISIKEKNGNKIVNVPYYIYDLQVDNDTVALKVDEEKNVKVLTIATGNVTAISANPKVARVEVEPLTDYSYESNHVNEQILKITAEGSGTTTITINGGNCGEKKIRVNVSGRTLSINLKPGTYTESVGQDKLSCITSGIFRSCEVVFPSINTTSEFNVVGYSEVKDSQEATYKPGDTIVLNYSNNGKTFYGNSADTTSPVCTFSPQSSSIAVQEETELNLTCVDMGSGIVDGTLRPEDFHTSSNSVGEVIRVSPAIKIEHGYTYKVTVKAKEPGLISIFLNASVLSDRYNNSNKESILSNVFASEYLTEKFWFVGKENAQDVIAALYDNEDMQESEKGYTLKLYGNKEMIDFRSALYNDFPPWYDDYRSLISKVEFTDGITNVGNYAFYNASSLKSVFLPKSIINIGIYAFANAKLDEVVIPENVNSIKEFSFYDNGISSLKLGNNLKTIEAFAFYGHKIKELSIPSETTSIGEGAFASKVEDAGTLTQLTFASDAKLVSISDMAFVYHGLESLSVPRIVATIGQAAFANNTATLKNLDFSMNNHLKTISDEAFLGSSISNLSPLPKSLEYIGSRSLGTLDEGITTFTVPVNVSHIGEEFVYGKELEEFIVDENNTTYRSVDGILYTKDGNTLVKCPDAYHKNHEQLNVIAGTKNIFKGAFNGYLSYGNGVKGLIVNLPSSIIDINIENNFISFTIGEINIVDNSNYTSEDGVLYNKDKTVIYRLPTVYSHDAYTIPDSVSEIADDFAYANMRVKTITVPPSVQIVGSNAFNTDSRYALDTINLNTGPSVKFDITTFALMSFDRQEELANLSRTINVLQNTLKSKIDQMYSNSEFKINTFLTS